MHKRRLSLLIMLLVAAVGSLAVLHWPTPWRRAMARVEALQGTYVEQMDEKGGVPHPINVLMLTLRPVTEEDLMALRDLRPLHRVLLDGSPVTDAGLAYLGELPELEMLSLMDTQVTDAGLAHLAGLQRLEILILRRTRVTDAGLAQLGKLPALALLNVSESPVTDRGVSELRRLRPEVRVDFGVSRFAAD
jgi:hypothetical protein